MLNARDKPSGNGQRTWILKMKAPPPNLLQTGLAEAAPNAPPPAPPPKRSAEAATLTTDEGRGQEKQVTEQALIPTAPSESRLDLMRHSCPLSRQLLGGRRGAEHSPLDRCQLQNMQRRNGLR